MVLKKPIKKTDKELFILIEQKIKEGSYIFLSHAKQRLVERHISDLDVINVLSGKKGCERTRNKKKDTYDAGPFGDLASDWKYCIEGQDVDANKLRIIVTFTEELMPIITVIRI